MAVQSRSGPFTVVLFASIPYDHALVYRMVIMAIHPRDSDPPVSTESTTTIIIIDIIQ